MADLNFSCFVARNDNLASRFDDDKTHKEGEDAAYDRQFFHNPESMFSFVFILACHIFFNERPNMSATGDDFHSIFFDISSPAKGFENWLKD